VTDRRTDGQTDRHLATVPRHSPRYAYASPGKKLPVDAHKRWEDSEILCKRVASHGQICGQNSKFLPFWRLCSHSSALTNVKYGTGSERPLPRAKFQVYRYNVSSCEANLFLDNWVNEIQACCPAGRPASNTRVSKLTRGIDIANLSVCP